MRQRYTVEPACPCVVASAIIRCQLQAGYPHSSQYPPTHSRRAPVDCPLSQVPSRQTAGTAGKRGQRGGKDAREGRDGADTMGSTSSTYTQRLVVVGSITGGRLCSHAVQPAGCRAGSAVSHGGRHDQRHVFPHSGQRHYPDRQGGVSASPLSLQLPCGDLPAQSRHRSEVAQRLWLIDIRCAWVRLRAVSARQQLKTH